jgi:maltose alpha-D-glucosyltransferase/alpha-amylase
MADDTPTRDWYDDPLWYKDAIIYQLHVKAFFDADNDGVGDFEGLTAKLDYIQELGVNTLWVLPFYPSPMRDDGYDIAEYTGVHADYGTLASVERFIEEAHRRKLKVVTELVINHTSDQHPWFQAARRAPAGSPPRDFYVWSDTDDQFADTRIIFTDTESSNWAWDEVAGAYYFHRFFSHQPDLNHNNPAVVDAVIKVMRFWLDKGVDGLRLDAIPYLCVREGTSNENLPETHAVIRRMRAVVDENYQGRVFLAEANQWPEDVREYFGNGDECHMAYHFPLMPRIFMAVALEDRYPIAEILRQTPSIPENCQWAIFLRNHDELTLEMVTDRERDYMYRMYAQERRMRVNVGIRRRLAPLLENDIGRIKLVTSLLLSMPGSPILYYGDEIGMGDNIFLGDRNGVRTPMQWSPDRNAGFSRADPQRLYLPVVMDAVYGFQSVNVEAQVRDPSSLLNWVRQVLATRRRHPLFGRGSLEFVRPANRKILAYTRSLGEHVILCVNNLSHTAQAVELDLSRYRGRVPIELSGGNPFPPVGDLPYLLTLPGHGVFWLHLVAGADAPSWHSQWLAAPDLPVLVLSQALQTFTVPTAAAGAVAQRANAALATDVLPEFLRARRWFARKNVPIAGARLADPTPWRTARGEWLLALAEVQFEDAVAESYLLPLALAWEEDAAPGSLRTGPFAVSQVRQRARAGLLLDAFGDPAFSLSMIEAVGHDFALATPAGGEWRFRPTSVFQALAAKGLEPVQPLFGDQSNTAVIAGESIFLKSYRQLRAGVNPEVEVGLFLTEHTTFRHFAPLAGTVDYQPPQGGPITVAALFAYTRNQGDGWSYTLDHLQRFTATHRSEPGGPDVESDHALYLAQVTTLGRRVGELHQALAAPTDEPGFSPEPVRPRDLRDWGREVRGALSRACSLLRSALPTLGVAAREDAQWLLRERRRLEQRVSGLASGAVTATRTRVHGDLHLGQVLLVENDFMIIDFEGEPARTLDERRRKHSPLRDVAGMLRSFDYARAAALERAVAARPADRPVLETALDDWCRRARSAFLAGYREGVAGAGSCPAEPVQFDRLVALFEIDKALYELGYELRQRPAWVGVPLAGLRALGQERNREAP